MAVVFEKTVFMFTEYMNHFVKEVEMDGTYRRYGRDEKYIQNFGGENLKGRDDSEEPGVADKIILELILWKWCEKM
jgi:hypothetical protein